VIVSASLLLALMSTPFAQDAPATNPEAIRHWQGIVPGETTRGRVSEVLGSNGRLLEGAECDGVKGLEVRDYEDEQGDALAMICFKDGKVWIVRQVLIFVRPPAAGMRLTFYQRMLGEAEGGAMVSYQGRAYDHLVWPQHGIAVDAERRTGKVRTRQLFVPTTLERYERDVYVAPDQRIK
jgi:hypothetical protein